MHRAAVVYCGRLAMQIERDAVMNSGMQQPHDRLFRTVFADTDEAQAFCVRTCRRRSSINWIGQP